MTVLKDAVGAGRWNTDKGKVLVGTFFPPSLRNVDKLRGAENQLSLTRQVRFSASLKHLWVNVYPGYASGGVCDHKKGGGTLAAIAGAFAWPHSPSLRR